VRDGTVLKLLAGPRYGGLVAAKVGLGMTVGKAMTLIPEMIYEEMHEEILIRATPGILFGVREDFRLPSPIIKEKITWISVLVADNRGIYS